MAEISLIMCQVYKGDNALLHELIYVQNKFDIINQENWINLGIQNTDWAELNEILNIS